MSERVQNCMLALVSLIILVSIFSIGVSLSPTIALEIKTSPWFRLVPIGFGIFMLLFMWATGVFVRRAWKGKL